MLSSTLPTVAHANGSAVLPQASGPRSKPAAAEAVKAQVAMPLGPSRSAPATLRSTPDPGPDVGAWCWPDAGL